MVNMAKSALTSGLPALLLIGAPLIGQDYVVEWDPPFPTDQDSVMVTFYADRGTAGLAGYSGTVYAHSAVITNLSGSDADWRYVIGEWGDNSNQPALTYVASDVYTILIVNPRAYYGVPAVETIEQLTFVFRSADASREGKAVGANDIFVPITNRLVNVRFLEPGTEDTFISAGDSVVVVAIATGLEMGIATMTLLVDGIEVLQVAADTLRYTFRPPGYGRRLLSVIAVDNAGQSDSASLAVQVNPALVRQPRPAGVVDGINYIDDQTVVLSLFAPYKQFVYVIGEFNHWQADTAYYMRSDSVAADSVHFWLTVSGLVPGKEYPFQYLVDGQLRIADPYTDKILDPWNDQYISDVTYPDLISYPVGFTDQAVAVLQTGQQPFAWTDAGFIRPAARDLVIYELLLRDFTDRHDFKTLRDSLDYLKRLGINAIEVLPFNEFEGNSSWGYNPSFYFAPDKYYGAKDDLKAFIDAAHGLGIAVIMDLVLNHSYGQSPLVRLYWEGSGPSAENRWYNQEHNFANTDARWGHDFNHESPATQAFVDRVNRFWLEEYHLDGFRFDFTKGFSNTYHSASDPWGGDYDPARIAILKRMADRLWEVDSSAYVILEHFADNSEEQVLADYGMLLWGNSNYNYNEATMGWHEDGKSDFSWGYYGTRGWTAPHLVTYMESHDEERLMYKNLTWGNASGNYSIKALGTALNRIKLAAAFFLTLPGPKMLWQFGELGYDYSIDYDGRLGEKPVRWDYLQDQGRYNLYLTMAALLRLRRENAVFGSSETQVALDLGRSSGLKRIQLSGESMSVIIIGNFGVTAQSIAPDFPATGTWYDFFPGDSMLVAAPDTLIDLRPGEFHIYTDQRLEPPEPDILNEPIAPPTAFTLGRSYPNPFNPTKTVTTINYTVPVDVQMRLVVYDLLGREVARLFDGPQEVGYHQAVWNGRTTTGRVAPSGIYLARLVTPESTKSIKMLLLK